MLEATGTKDKIFDVAIDLFYEHGFHGVSVRKIAYGAGIKESSIYNHYENKEDILNRIFDCFQEGMREQRPDETELEYMIEYMAPREVFRLIFIKYGKNRNQKIDKIAAILFREQYGNQKARSFVRQFMFDEPIIYYEEILKAMAKRGKLHEGVNTRIAARELHYGFLGIIFDLSTSVHEGNDVSAVIEKLSNHVDFIFEQLEK
jgi:AcrR family transcriptional regulator